MTTFRKKSLRRLAAVFVSVVLGSTMIAGTTAMTFAANNMPVNDSSQNKKGIFYTDYATPDDLMDAAKELAEEISEEGMVLMQNANNALPLSRGMRVSVFGKSSVNPAYGGGGSGALIDVTPVSLYDGLHNAGFKTNGVLESFYKNDSLSGTGRSDKTYTNETPIANYTDGITSSYDAYNDAAIVVLTRTGAEGSDLPRTGNANDENALYLSVTPDEIALIDHVNKYFDKVIVLVNSSNTIELGAIKDKVDSILWVGNPGERGFNSVGRILNGEVNPSGKLVDVYVNDLTMDPTWANFGNNSQNKGVTVYTRSGSEGAYTYKQETILYNAIHQVATATGNEQVTVNNAQTTIPAGTPIYEKGGTYTEYEEGIYVGYRYYETRAYEMGVESDWYENTVDFTFGHGESYTTFERTWASTPEISLTKNGTVELKVTVTNTGKYAGKDVVQLYYSAPYFDDGIEKSVVNLGAYAKTDMLAPGESQTVTLTMKVQDMASFDWNDANGNGFRGYELEAGTYSFFVGDDAHCWADNATLSATASVTADSSDSNFGSAAKTGANGYTYTTDSNTGNEIKVLFSNDDIYNTNLMQDENKLKRSSFAAASETENIIQEKTVEDFALEEAGWEQIGKTSHVFDIEDDAGDWYAFEGEEHAPWYVAEVPETAGGEDAWTQWDDSKGTRPEAPYTFEEMAGWDYEDPRWEEVLNSLSWKELKDIVYVAGFTNAEVDYIGKDMAIDDDGPMQVKLDQSPMEGTNDDFTGTGWPCAVLVAATWNTELAERQGVMIGNECLYLGISGWFAPAMNLHRNQYGGRIFEYYSSDPVQGGKIAAAVTRGVQSKGVYAFLKHFCLNNQDTGRGSISIVVNEQAMRELYMYTFELAVEEGGAHGLMTYYSFVGGVSIMHNYAILTEYVRNQWGFQGVINHDYGPESYNASICTPALTRRVGNGLGGNGATYDRYADQDYYDPQTNMVYYCLDGAGKVVPEGQEVASPSHWAAMRESAKQLLWTTANSNNQKNGLELDMFAGKEISVKQDVALSDVTIGVDTTKYGTQNVSYKIIKGALPDGITLNEYTGELSGTTQEVGEYEFTVRMRSDFWIKNDQTFTLTVAPSVTISAGTTTEVGKEYYGAIQAETFEEANDMSYTLVEGALPDGLTLTATGEIEGTPTKPGTYDCVINIHGVIEVPSSRPGRPATQTPKDLEFRVTFTVTGELPDPVEIGENGNWFINGQDTGVAAAGQNGTNGTDGKDGVTPTIEINDDGYWVINGTVTDVKAEASGSGCSGNIEGTLISVIAAFAAIGFVIVLRRKKANK